jgi:transposase-like protein/transposase
MRGPKPKYTIELTTEEGQELRKLANSRKASHGKVIRAQILLAAYDHPEWSNQQIAREMGCTDRTVRKWRQRWAKKRSIEDLPRPGAPRRFSPEVRAQATALACSRPREKGVPLARWSNAEIARRLVDLGLVARIAVSTVGRWLAAEELRPWRYHTWQHILDPQAFLERARPVLRLYERACELLKQGFWLVCVDEKTSIQAREGTQTPAPAVPGHPVHISSRYKRQGALNLFSGLSVADGQVYGQCRLRKRFVDFQAFLLQVMIPEALRRGVHTLALILDNGTTHAPKQLERWLQEQIESHGWALSIQVYWLPKNASWLDQIEIWFSVLQRKLLQPNHFESLEVLKQAILDFIDYYNQTAKAIQWSYTVEKLEQKLGAN